MPTLLTGREKKRAGATVRAPLARGKRLPLVLVALALASCAHRSSYSPQRLAPSAPERPLGPDSWAARQG